MGFWMENPQTYSLTSPPLNIQFPANWQVEKDNQGIAAFSPGNEVFFYCRGVDHAENMDMIRQKIALYTNINLTSFTRMNFPEFRDLDTDLTYYIFKGWANWGEEIPEEALNYLLLIGEKNNTYFFAIATGYYMMFNSLEKQIVFVLKQIIQNN